MVYATLPLLLVISVSKCTQWPDWGCVIRKMSTWRRKEWSKVRARAHAWCLIRPKLLTFSPVSVTMSNGPYMKRPTRVWGPSSVAMASFTLWLAVTFCNILHFLEKISTALQSHWNSSFQVVVLGSFSFLLSFLEKVALSFFPRRLKLALVDNLNRYRHLLWSPLKSLFTYAAF